jgi:hypothetical protein
VRQPDNRDTFHLQLPGSFEPSVTRNDFAVLADEYWIGETKLHDASRELINLLR